MSDTYAVRLTQDHLLRHAPARSTQGRDAAIIDIAQDLLLRHLSERGPLTLVVVKGGTALRKVYAGVSGRFSTDLDFAIASLDDDPGTIATLLAEEIDGTHSARSLTASTTAGTGTPSPTAAISDPTPRGCCNRRSTSDPHPGWGPPSGLGSTCPSSAAMAGRSPSCQWSTWPRTSPRRSRASTGADACRPDQLPHERSRSYRGGESAITASRSCMRRRTKGPCGGHRPTRDRRVHDPTTRQPSHHFGVQGGGRISPVVRRPRARYGDTAVRQRRSTGSIARPPALARRVHLPAATSRSSATASLMMVPRSRSSPPLAQRSMARRSTVMPASAAKVACISPTPRWRRVAATPAA